MNLAKLNNVFNATSTGYRIALTFLLVAFLAGCSGGGGGGGGIVTPFGVPKIDLHGDTAGFATLVVADGPRIHGAVNTPGDVDFFKFRGVIGASYTVQITGHGGPAPDLNNPTSISDFTILRGDGGTQLLNSTGTEGGTQYDIDPAGATADVDFFTSGDSRITWTCPATGVYYIRLEEVARATEGNYIISIATSRAGTQPTEYHTPQSRYVNVVDPDDGWLMFDGVVTGQLSGASLDINDFASTTSIFASGGVDEVTFFSDEPDPDTGIQPLNDEPETPAFHIHWGIPHANYPDLRLDATPNPGGDPHPFAFDISEEGDLTPELIRLIVGRPWYIDAHYTNQFDIDPEPVATSPPYGGTYDIFETDLDMSSQSVVPPPQFPRVPFTLKFDAALQTFQVAFQQYAQRSSDYLSGPRPTTPRPISPTAADGYAGGIIDIHRGARGTNGPVIIDLGRMPRSQPPPGYHTTSTIGDSVGRPPGQRQVVKILSDAEMDLFRREYYFGPGMYVDVHTAENPHGAARADIFLETVLDGQLLFTKSGVSAVAPGNVTFVSDYEAAGEITIVANGEIRGIIERASAGESECGEGVAGEAVSVELGPETYYYRAIGEDGTEWDGVVTVEDGSCETITLSVE